MTQLGDLLVLAIAPSDPESRPATVADLVSALRAEGVLVVGKVEGEWPAWAEKIQVPGRVTAIRPRPTWVDIDGNAVLDALAEAQPFPPAGGVS